MLHAQKNSQPCGRMLAFLFVLALLVTIVSPQGQDVFAEGGGGNDTITGSTQIDTISLVSLKKESKHVIEMTLQDWLIIFAITVP